nr:MAG TPA: hypothetical protein [Caudoviricetes sp.]
MYPEPESNRHALRRWILSLKCVFVWIFKLLIYNLLQMCVFAELSKNNAKYTAFYTFL